MKVNLIIGWHTKTIHALHKYAYHLKEHFSPEITAKTISCSRLHNSGWGEELTNYMKYPLIVRRQKNGADINHITSQEFAYLRNLINLKNTIVTVHDIFPITKDAAFTTWNYKLRVKWGLQALKKAQGIICNSQYTADSIKKYCRGKPMLISGMGYDEKIYNVQKKEEVTEKFQLSNEKYLIHVASENDRKNIPGLLHAFALAKKEIPDLQLIRVGSAQHQRNYEAHKKLAKDLRIESSIVRLKNVSEEELVQLYKKAELSVFPSFYEGFGMSPVESLAAGCPVVCSNGPPMYKTIKGAALFANPNSPEEIAKQIVRLLKDKELQKTLLTVGQEKIQQFTWRNIAKKTEAFYKKVTFS